jgi:hypothetical protein
VGLLSVDLRVSRPQAPSRKDGVPLFNTIYPIAPTCFLGGPSYQELGTTKLRLPPRWSLVLQPCSTYVVVHTNAPLATAMGSPLSQRALLRSVCGCDRGEFLLELPARSLAGLLLVCSGCSYLLDRCAAQRSHSMTSSARTPLVKQVRDSPG